MAKTLPEEGWKKGSTGSMWSRSHGQEQTTGGRDEAKLRVCMKTVD